MWLEKCRVRHAFRRALPIHNRNLPRGCGAFRERTHPTNSAKRNASNSIGPQWSHVSNPKRARGFCYPRWIVEGSHQMSRTFKRSNLVWSCWSNLVLLFCACASLWLPFPPNLAAQQPQNPSPMVEYSRAHPRLKQEAPPGRRETFELGTLFLPAKLKFKKALPLFVHFHGENWLPEAAAAKDGRRAVLSVQMGAGSARYADAFADPQRFGRLIQEIETRMATHIGPLVLTS